MKKLLAMLCIFTILTVFTAGCAESDTFVAKNYVAESEVESIFVDVSDRRLDIGVSDDGKVQIDYFDSEKEYFDISLNENKALSVKLISKKSWTDFIGLKPDVEYRRIVIKLPLSVTAVEVKTTNQKINAERLIAENVSFSNNGGDVEFNKIEVNNKLNISAKNGSIKGTVIGGWDDFEIICKIKKGKSNLPSEKFGGTKTLTVDCNNGDIDIGFTARTK